MADTTTTTEGYRAYIRFILRMYRLTRDGNFDSADADVARDEIDGVWDTLSASEKKRLRGLSLDLKYLLKSDRISETQPEGGAEKEAVVRKLRREDHLDDALDFLRASQDAIFAPSISTLRALIWSDLQEPDVARVFLNDAFDLNGSRVRSQVQAVTRDLVKAFHEKFGASLHEVDNRLLEEFVRENLQESLTSILTEQRRRQEVEIDEAMRSVRPASERSLALTDV